MRKWFRQWLFKEDDRYGETIRPAAEAIRDHPSIQAFKIDNGYIVRVFGEDKFTAMRAPSMVYCKDHQAIADYIVSQAAINKLAGNAQMELPLAGGYAGSPVSAKAYR